MANLILPEKIIYSGQTEFNYIEIKKRYNRYLLNSRNTNYSFGGLHKVFQHVFRKVPFCQSNVKNVLILGFGAGSVAHILQYELGCNCNITGIEIDKEVVNLAKRYFYMNNLKRTNVIIADALEFVNSCDMLFDIIVVDIFIDHKVPDKFNTIDFLSSLKKLLSTAGKVYFNRLCYDYSSKQQNIHFEVYFKQVFTNSQVVKIKGYSNNKVFIGSMI